MGFVEPTITVRSAWLEGAWPRCGDRQCAVDRHVPRRARRPAILNDLHTSLAGRLARIATHFVRKETPMLFSGKNIIITGATGDLGAAITQRMISQCANVLAVASNETRLARLAADISGPGTLETFVADVGDTKQVLGYAIRAFELWGQVDGFVNNAGIQTLVRPIVEFPEEDFDRVMAVNIRGVFLGLKYVLPRMRDRGCATADRWSTCRARWAWSAAPESSPMSP